MAMYKFTPQSGGKSKWEEEEEKRKQQEQSYNSFVDSLLGKVSGAASQMAKQKILPTVNTQGMNPYEKANAAANAVGYQKSGKKYTLENGGYTDWQGKFNKVDTSKADDLYVDSAGNVKERPKLYTDGDRASWLNLNQEQKNALTAKNVADVRDFQSKINSGEYYYLNENANRATDLLSTDKRKDVITGLEQERQAHNNQVQANVWDKNNVIDQSMIDNWHNSFENNALEQAYNNTHVGDGSYNQVIINKYNELFGDEMMRTMGHTIDPYSYDYRNLDPDKLRTVFEQEDIKQIDRDIIANNQDYFSTNEAYIEGMGLEKWVDVTDTQNAYNAQKDRQIADIQKGIDMDNDYSDYINKQYGMAGTGNADKSRSAEAEHAHFLITTPNLSHRDVTSPNGEVSNIIFMTDREKDIAERYYNAGDTAGMMAFIDGLSPYLDQSRNTYNKQNLRANADVLPVTSTALSVISNLAGGILGTFESLKEIATGVADPNSAGKNLTRSTQEIRGRVSSNLAEMGTINDFVSAIAGKQVDIPLFGNKSLGDVYNATLSGIDSALTSKIGLMTNSAKAVSLGLMGLEAFSSVYTQEIDSGKDPSEALLRAATDAGLEIATEIWSVDELLKDPGEFKNWFTRFARVYGAEVSEEVVGQILSPVLEYIETGENEYTRMYQDLLANQDTMPEEDRAAVNRAIWENILSPAFDMLFSTGPQTAIVGGRQMIEDRRLGKTITENDAAGMPVSYDQYVAEMGGTQTQENQQETESENEGTEALSKEVTEAVEDVAESPSASTTDNLLKIGKSINASKTTKNVIEAIEKRTEKGKAPTLTQVGALYRNISTDIAKNMAEGSVESSKAFQTSLSEYVATQLMENGYDGNADLSTLADGIAQATMEGVRSLDKPTRNAIINSKAAMDMVRQLTADADTFASAKEALGKLGATNTISNARTLQDEGVIGVSQEEKNIRNDMKQNRIANAYMNQILNTTANARANMIRNMAASGVREVANSTQNLATAEQVQNAKGEAVKTARGVIVDGRNAEISALKISNDGITIHMKDGSSASIYDVKTANEGMNTILGFAEQNSKVFNEKVFNNIIHAFNGTTTNEALSMIGDVASVYTSVFMEQEMPTGLSIGDKLTQTVFNQAKADYESSEKKRISRRIINTGHGQVTFRDNVEANLTEEQKQGVEDLKALGRAIGYDFVLYDGKNDNLGSYDVATGAIALDITQTTYSDSGSNAVMIAATHELTHFLEHNSPTQYAKLRSYVIQNLKGKVNFDKLVRQKMEREGIGNLTYAGAVAEVVADACQDILPDSKKIQELMNHDQSLYDDFKGFMKGFVNRIRDAIGIGGRSVETAVMNNAKEYNEKLAELWDAALTEALDHSGVEMASENEVIKPQDEHTGSISPESGDISFSIRENKAISDRSIKYFNGHRNQSEHISEEAFNAANDIINEMADYMKPFLDSTNNKGLRYLPEEILGKTTFQNGSYGKTIENTTICFRTLAYIDFTNEIKERIGRPLTVEESFLASQMLYDIAKEPQCLYCYVSLDRKAYDGFLLEYTKQRDNVIEKYNALENKSKENVDKLYEEFLNGRKNTRQMRGRFDLWINTVKNGNRLIGNADLTTEERRSQLKNGEENALAKQVIDAEKYAQSASWAKKLEQYRSYNSDILSMSEKMVNNLNAHYGLRFYSFSEYTPAFILENMQQIRDASIKGLYGLAYTKKTDFARIFANTGMNINVSCFGRMDHGNVVPDTFQGADWEEVQQLRKEHKNVGAVFVATNDQMTEWALAQDWIDVVIPFHIVRTGANVAEFYKWTNNTAEQADKNASGKNMTISPSEFHNDRDTFMKLVEERGLTPRFSKWVENPNYMKLVNETRLSDLDSVKLHPDFDLEAAKKSFDTFVEDGGYYGNWYKEGADYQEAVNTVSEDILAGKRANQVDYGRQDIDMSDAKRNMNKRVHGQQRAFRNMNREVIDDSPETMKANKKYVAVMEPVADSSYEDYKVFFDGDFIENAGSYFDSIGKYAFNNEIGQVELAKSGLRHIVARKDVSPFKAKLIPLIKPVIENGKVINIENNHNGKPVDTCLIAAKVTLDKGTDLVSAGEYYMGVMVSQDNGNTRGQKNRFSFHNAIMVNKKDAHDGSMIVLDDSVTNKAETSSIISILKSIREVNEISSYINADGEPATNEQIEASDVTTQYSLREKPAPKKIIECYKAFYVRDGKLYPPMISNVTNDKDKSNVKNATSGTMKGLETPVGVWLDADVGGLSLDENGEPTRTKTTGRLQVKNDKSGGKATLAFRPGWHLGEFPDAHQFYKKDPVTGIDKSAMPDDLVFAKCEIAADVDYQLEALELGVSEKGGFSRTQAGLPRVPVDGFYKYRTNANPAEAPWFISGSMRITEILDDEQCREICAQFGVTPANRVSHHDIDLEAFGLKKGKVTTTENLERFKKNKASYDNDKILEKALADERYSNAYVRRKLNFDDPTLINEFKIDLISDEQVEEYRKNYSFEQHSKRDSDGNSLSANQQKYFADSKIRDEDGNLRVVYHGTDQEFTVFDRTKGRATMDIQGSFFSPWEDDAGGYGGEVNAYYLNIMNPASESEGYKALNMFKGQNNAGVKAREYLESLGYDGVNNGDEEYIAFYPEQIKLVSNTKPTSDPDIRFSKRQQLLDVRSYLNSLDTSSMAPLKAEQIKKFQRLYADMNRAQETMYDLKKRLAEAPKGEKVVLEDQAKRSEKAYLKALHALKNYEQNGAFTGTLQEAQRFAVAVQNFGLDEASERYKDWTKGDLVEQINKMKDKEALRSFERKAKANMDSMHRKIQNNVKWIKDLRMHETDYKNIPEDLKPLADDVVKLFASEDQFGGSLVWNKNDAEKLMEKYSRLQANPITEEMYSDDVMENLMNLHQAMIDLTNARSISRKDEDSYKRNVLMLSAMDKMSKAVADVRNLIKAQREAFLGEQKMTISEAAHEVINPASEKEDYREFKGAIGQKISGMDRLIRRGNMTPDYFFRNLKNAGLTQANEGFHRGENQYGLDLNEAKKRVDAIREKYHYHDWDNKRKLNFTTTQGREITLTPQQAMSLYATWKRENQTDIVVSKHLENGGFVYSDADMDKGILGRESRLKSGNQISQEDMDMIIGFLTDEQIRYADEMVNYLSTDMGAKGNETSMALYGIKKYNEKYYFPIKSFAGNLHQKSDVGTVSGTNDNRIKHASFTNSRLNNAQNAVLLQDFDEVVANHINQMLTYSNMVIPIETMNRILNYKTVTEDGSEQTVRAMIEQKYGTNAANYLQGYLKDLNGGMTVDNRGDMGVLLSTFKKAAVAGSLSVAAQQPLSYIRASMMINPVYLARAMSPDTFKGSYSEMLAHSGVAVIKDMGKFDMGYGRGAVNWLLDKEQSLYEKVSDKITILPELMDKATWSRMWSAVKQEQMAKHKDMDFTSDEFLDMVGERFNAVMRLTQVYDSVLAKSENMRSKNYGAKVLTSFMAEPTLTANMLYDAYSRFKEKGGKANIVKASALFLLSAAAQAAVKGMFGTGRRPDEKKTKEEEFDYKFLQAFYSEANPLGLIPGFSTLMDALSGSDIDDSAWSVITQMGESLQKTAKMIASGDFSYQGIEESAGLLAQLFTDIPVKNLMRDARAMVNWFGGTPYADRETSQAVLKYQAQEALTGSDMVQGLNQILVDAGWGGFQTTNKAYYKRIFEAQEAGNTSEADAMTEYLTLAKGVKPETINSGIKSASGGYDTLWEAIDTNKSDNIKGAVSYMEKYGYDRKNMISQITSHYKSDYLNASSAEKVRIKNKLIMAYKACGLTEAEANKKINSWKA